jgi:tRNA-uridine 2-sulfurtransferase
MDLHLKKAKGLGLCSGGLDSMLAALVLREQGIGVFWVSFETPFFSADKARRASGQTGIPLTVVDITDRYLPMLKHPPGGYGKYMNPCMDCHALMFRIAGEIMVEKGYDFLFSGEVMGQRPMSQTKNSLRYVEKRSGFDGLILRPLSARLLPETIMEQKGMVDRERLCDFSGRSRKPQMGPGEKI